MLIISTVIGNLADVLNEKVAPGIEDLEYVTSAVFEGTRDPHSARLVVVLDPGIEPGSVNDFDLLREAQDILKPVVSDILGMVRSFGLEVPYDPATCYPKLDENGSTGFYVDPLVFTT